MQVPRARRPHAALGPGLLSAPLLGLALALSACPASGPAGGPASHRLHRSLVDLAHLADRSRDGLLALDLGTVGGRKYALARLGGWRTELRRRGDVDFFTARGRSARLFFSHRRHGFAGIAVRMQAPRGARPVVFRLNGVELGSRIVGEAWLELALDVPAEATRDGQNELELHFLEDPDLPGSAVVLTRVDRVDVLPAGATSDGAPRGPAVDRLRLGSDARRALVTSAPQTYTFRLDVPAAEPQLRFAWGSQAPGVRFAVTARADTVPARTLFEAEVGPGDAGRWHPASLDLAALAGTVAELALEIAGPLPDGRRAGWAEPGIHARLDGARGKERAEARPGGATEHPPARNLLIYLIDTMRRDKLAAYAPATRVATPHFDAFAADAAVFENAYTAANWTKPSCATLLTGLDTDTHKTVGEPSVLPPGATLLSEYLQRHRFETAAFIANEWLIGAFGFARGWDSFANLAQRGGDYGANAVVDEVLAWLDRRSGERFFAYVHTQDPHAPYWPPAEWRARYWDAPHEGPVAGGSFEGFLAVKEGRLPATDADKRYLEAHYDAEIAFNDHHFGRLLEGLRQRGLYDDTAIVVVADHGEELWDHGRLGHPNSLHDELVRSVLLLRHPPRVAPGTRVPEVVAAVDVVPTLLDLADVENQLPGDGNSLLDLLRGAPSPGPRIAVADWAGRAKAVRAGRFKWIFQRGREQLYDVVSDPRERRELHGEYPIARAYGRGLLGLYLGARDKSRWWSADASARRRPELPALQGEIDPALRERLRAVGYLADDAPDTGPGAPDDPEGGP